MQWPRCQQVKRRVAARDFNWWIRLSKGPQPWGDIQLYIYMLSQGCHEIWERIRHKLFSARPSVCDIFAHICISPDLTAHATQSKCPRLNLSGLQWLWMLSEWRFGNIIRSLMRAYSRGLHESRSVKLKNIILCSVSLEFWACGTETCMCGSPRTLIFEAHWRRFTLYSKKGTR